MHIERVHSVTDELQEAFARLMPQLTANWPPPSRELLQQITGSAQVALFVARAPDSAGVIVGAATLAVVLAPSGAHARIEDVVVDSDYRGQGIGQALILALLDHARRLRVKYVALTSNPRREAANKLYQKLGFTPWQTNVYRYDICP